MVKRAIFMLSSATLAAAFFFSGCNDDETPVIGFKADSSSVTEGNTVKVPFSSTVPNGVTPVIALSGTATEDTDYTFTMDNKEITFTVPDDFIYDPSETINIEITGFDGNANVGSRRIHVVTITDKDQTTPPGLRVELRWDVDAVTSGNQPGDVDMDLFLWIEDPPGSDDYYIIDGSAQIGNGFEAIFLPSNNPTDYPNRAYGLGYNYYSGTSDNLKVNVSFKVFKGAIDGGENQLESTATYTLANINAWDITDEFYIVQFFEKVDANFNNFTDISVPVSGSRTSKLKAKLNEALYKKRIRKN
jgi:hypothetical protein